MQPLGKSSASPYVRKPHSIRLVEIPPSSGAQRGIKLSMETADGLPISPESYGCRGLRISDFNTRQVCHEVRNSDEALLNHAAGWLLLISAAV
ncbi:hypothetical protein PR048_012421 [Dryococelus australis]|uniref:Uncharacterized protein n=1 Tax=Dryococelus australis TaxID=614101 RepID=A0ABQ9HPG1_9NEOP|nr:hypothetical protein PR048_012421 [Dryococelus australis]